MTERKRVFDGSGEGIYLPGSYGMNVAGDALNLYDPDDNQMMYWTRDDSDGGQFCIARPGESYGFLGIQGSAAANEVACFGANSSSTAGSSGGFWAAHQSASGGSSFYDYFRFNTSSVFTAGWRVAMVQADADALKFSSIASNGNQTHLFRYGRDGAYSVRSISAPEAVPSFVTFYVDAGDNHFKRKDADGTVVDLQLPSGAGLTIGGTITGGADNRVLFESAANVVAETAAFTYDSIGDILRVGGVGGNPVSMIQGGQVTVNDGGAAESIVGAGTLSCTGDLAIGNAVAVASPGAATRTIAIQVGGVSLKLLAVVG